MPDGRGRDEDFGFLSEPIGVELLSGFEKFDLGSVASWSHVELYAAAFGWEIDLPFLKVVLVLSYYFPGVYDATTEEIDAYSREVFR